MHGLVLSHNVSFFLRQCTSVLQHLLSLATFHRPLCAMNPPVWNSFNNLMYSFLVILLLCCPSIFQFLASLTALLPSSRIWIRFYIFRVLLCPLAPACSSPSVLVPFPVSHSPRIFYTKSNCFPTCPFFLPYRVLPHVAPSIGTW